MKMRYLPATLLFCSLAITAAFSQTDKPRHAHPKRELRAETQAYVQKNVLPVMQEQRLKLEKELSSADKKQIRELRSRMAAARKQMDSFREEFKNQRHSGTNGLTEVQREQMQRHHAEMKSIITEAHMLAQKYKPDIQDLYTEIATPLETWKTDLRTLQQKQADENFKFKEHKRFAHRGPSHRFMNEYLRPVNFLLWDVKKPISEMETSLDTGNKVFPNPASNTSTLEYINKKAGPVSVELLDEQGQVIRKVANHTQTPGTYTLNTDLNNLKSGVYFYKITTSTGTETMRFLKK